jgi:hypothetical protein
MDIMQDIQETSTLEQMPVKKSSFKKILIEAVFIIALFCITVYCIFYGEDVHEIMGYIRNANPFWVLGALLLVLLFICMESVIIHYIMHSLHCKIRMRDCIRYSFVGFFVSAITPSASGGQPAQMYFMKKDGIDISVSTLVLMVVTIAYKFTLVFLSAFVLIFSKNMIVNEIVGVEWIIALGFLLNVVIVTALILAVFLPNLAKRMIVVSMIKLGKRGLIKDYQKKVSKALHGLSKYSAGSIYLKSNLHVILNVLVMTIIQRTALFMVTYFVYRAFGLSGTSAYKIVLLQTLIALAVDNLPLPGGMGANEWLYNVFFEGIMGTLLIPNLILSRSISYYAQIVFGAIVTLISLILKPKNYKEQMQFVKSINKPKEKSC